MRSRKRLFEGRLAPAEEWVEVGRHKIGVQRSARRKTMTLMVDRDGTVKIQAPVAMDLGRARDFAVSHLAWIEKYVAEKERLRPPEYTRRKEYVSGETFYYLGEAHRLRIVPGNAPLTLGGKARGGVELGAAGSGAFWELGAERQAQAEEEFIEFYKRNLKTILAGVVAKWAPRFGLEGARVTIRPASNRWASYNKGRINANWQLALIPMLQIEYVIAHELAHDKFMDHSRAFWTWLGMVMPDWESRKAFLRDNGATWLAGFGLQPKE